MKKSTAITYFGNATNLAKAIGINPSAVYQWPEKIPRGRAFELQHLTNGELKVDLNEFAPTAE
ncbi:MAG: DNA-binding transcriptional regulator YdaS (Cro superfamily) [Psychromonas sp.]|jgi:DNA-binding transcriptional regulator YdaS (Cro superfamily)|uniref:Cro/CI family transcriptional regulator n=1 Tax=Psychromonas sp. TaxID=1884585 RepID=UPI0039E544F4